MSLSQENQMLIVNAACHAYDMIKLSEQQAASQKERPSYLMKPKLSRDGNQWCALYGEDLQSGIIGFGDSPHLAMCDFDREWEKKI